MNSGEEWKDIKGYEGIYLISNFGRVLSLYRFRSNGKQGYFQLTKMLKPSMTTTGYYKVDLKKDNKRENYKVHRLVAEYFVPNPYKLDTVNHKDGNPLNNHFENLEWCNQSDNILHALETGLTTFFDIDKRTLEYLYIEKNMTPNEIGVMLGVSRVPIDAKIEEYGIKKEFVTKYQINEQWLKEEIKKGKRNKEIAKKIGCDVSLISHYRQRLKKKGKIYG